MMSDEKRRRCYNSYEIDILLACVEQRKHIIENKIINAVNNRDKTAAWKAVCTEFNNVIGVQKCSVEQLQNLYRNTKRKLTKKAADKRAATFRNGGEKAADELAPYEERMREMGGLRMPLKAPFDSDGIFENPSNNIEMECIVPEKEKLGYVNLRTPSSIVPEGDSSNTTSNSSSTKLKMTTPKSSLPARFFSNYKNKVKRRELATAKAASVIDQQAEVRKLQIEEIKLMKDKTSREMELNEEKLKNDMLMTKEKHEQQMRHAEERLKMQKMEHEMQIQRFQMEKDEHELKMKLLRAQLQKNN